MVQNLPSKGKCTSMFDKDVFLWAWPLVRGVSPMGATGPSCPHLIIHSTAHKLSKSNALGHFETLINIYAKALA